MHKMEHYTRRVEVRRSTRAKEYSINGKKRISLPVGAIRGVFRSRLIEAAKWISVKSLCPDMNAWSGDAMSNRVTGESWSSTAQRSARRSGAHATGITGARVK